MAGKVLLIGSGGREHALAWKLSQSSKVESVFVAPGNAGTHNDGKVSNVGINVKSFESVSQWCTDNGINLVVIGPEDPLAAGMADHLKDKGIPCFGPSAKAAEIEASKDFAKQFMTRHNIPTARFQSFTEYGAACNHINSANYKALVVKASGLAAGKGVVVAETREEACQAVRDMLQDKKFGAAGETVVIEELLEGEEVSVLGFSDGMTVSVMPPAQDHKRLEEGDRGPNTGGMGALCPYPKVSVEDLKQIKENIIQKTIDGLCSEGRVYVGVLYAGLMLTQDGPKVLEFNCRFGDPETQSILPLLKSDLFLVCKACVDGTLSDNIPEFDQDHSVMGIVVVSGGYPGSYKKGLEISGIEDAQKIGLKVFHAGTAQKDDSVVTSGGRVLAVLAVDKDLRSASFRAQQGAALIKFENSFFRKDIGCRVVPSQPSSPGPSYKDAGVNIEAGSNLVSSIKPLAESTNRPGCMSSVGMFGALFDLKAAGYTDPVLVSGTDGVGTKLKIAKAVGCHNSVGIDLVAMCVNDILAHGAEPLFFLDYFATGQLNIPVAKDVIAGITEGCKQAGCALIGGETAEMPGMYSDGEYDIAGFAVGAVERDKMLPRQEDIKIGDVVIGLASNGIHSNGFSLVRKVIDKKKLRYDMPSPLKTGKTLGEDLLTPTKIYVNSLHPLIKTNKIKAIAHITGGGLVENIPRVLTEGLGVCLDAKSWNVPSVFGWLAEMGRISEKEMTQTFNCGIGAALIVNRNDEDGIIKHLSSCGENAFIIGSVQQQRGEKRVTIDNLDAALVHSWRQVPGVTRKKRVGVLISGSGTNLQALLDYTRDPDNSSAAEIVLVISNKAGVVGLDRARNAGVQAKVIKHQDYKSRADFDEALHTSLLAAGVEIVCLAGFMRILTGGFVEKWKGRLLNVHPSLLPSFKGGDAHKQVIASGVRISGCTVHFVAEEVDAGAILVQDAVPVYPDDTENSLAERVKTVEHKAFPQALELVASERVVLNGDGKLQWQN